MCRNSNEAGGDCHVPQGISIRREGADEPKISPEVKAQRVENYLHSFEVDGKKFFLDIGNRSSKRRN